MIDYFAAFALMADPEPPPPKAPAPVVATAPPRKALFIPAPLIVPDLPAPAPTPTPQSTLAVPPKALGGPAPLILPAPAVSPVQAPGWHLRADMPGAYVWGVVRDGRIMPVYGSPIVGAVQGVACPTGNCPR